MKRVILSQVHHLTFIFIILISFTGKGIIDITILQIGIHKESGHHLRSSFSVDIGIIFQSVSTIPLFGCIQIACIPHPDNLTEVISIIAIDCSS